jgi:hypothetical protein
LQKKIAPVSELGLKCPPPEELCLMERKMGFQFAVYHVSL